MISSFFFKDTAPTEIYTLSLHDALPICPGRVHTCPIGVPQLPHRILSGLGGAIQTASHDIDIFEDVLGEDADRKSTRLNSSHANISYAVFCLKKKKK